MLIKVNKTLKYYNLKIIFNMNQMINLYSKKLNFIKMNLKYSLKKLLTLILHLTKVEK